MCYYLQFRHIFVAQDPPDAFYRGKAKCVTDSMKLLRTLHLISLVSKRLLVLLFGV